MSPKRTISKGIGENVRKHNHLLYSATSMLTKEIGGNATFVQ